MNKGFFEKKIIKIIVFNLYFFLGILYAYYAREYKEISSTFAHQAVLFDGLILSAVSLALNIKQRNEKNKYNLLLLFLIMSMFFYASKLYMNSVASLSAFIVSIFTQSRVIVTFLFHILILRKKFCITEFLGVFLICMFILIISYTKNNKKMKDNQIFKLKFALLTSLSSGLSGLASCFFDSEIKSKIYDHISYSLESNFIYFLVALVYHLIYINMNNISFFDGFNQKRFYIIAGISSSISGIAMLNCFCFNVIERMIMSFLSKILSDLIIDIIFKYEIETITCICYFGVIFGSIIFKYNEIVEAFKK